MQQPGSGGGGETINELRSDATQLGNSAADRIHSEVDNRKEGAVTQAKSVSSAIQRAAGDMGQDTPDWIKSALQQGAQKLQAFAETIDQKNSRELMADAQDFARNNPGTFLAACAAAGFAAARILKAGGEPEAGSQRPSASGSSVPAYPNSADATPTQANSSTPHVQGEFA